MEDYLESGSIDGDDIFPCKGCGEVRAKSPKLSCKRNPKANWTCYRY